MIKQFAYFLPQFHVIPENDMWWGKGFTEWTNVKSARPLFRGHNQPRIPLNNNYYNLLDKDTVLWQTQLMKKYGIDGLIYYHYYFSEKNMLLQKPAENLLRWKDIDQKFFFCWANESWNRSWRGEKTEIMKQEYGNVEEWDSHLMYLLPFFKDNRYEKIENKPILMLFRSDFPEKNRMLDYWDDRLRELGFSGIYVIESFKGNSKKKDFGVEDFKKNMWHGSVGHMRQFLNSKMERNQQISYLPQRIFYKAIDEIGKSSLARKYNFKLPIRRYDGDDLYDIMLEEYRKYPELIPGVSFAWDNTPRHSFRGYLINPVSKEKYIHFMNEIKEADFVFINAWNEWAEGTMLEPTEDQGYRYLEWIKEWKMHNNV